MLKLTERGQFYQFATLTNKDAAKCAITRSRHNKQGCIFTHGFNALIGNSITSFATRSFAII